MTKEEKFGWLVFCLGWLYHHKHLVEFPLMEVAILYADFDYPEEMNHFVYYMPMEGENLGSVDANIQRLYDRWKQFVDNNSP